MALSSAGWPGWHVCGWINPSGPTIRVQNLMNRSPVTGSPRALGNLALPRTAATGPVRTEGILMGKMPRRRCLHARACGKRGREMRRLLIWCQECLFGNMYRAWHVHTRLIRILTLYATPVISPSHLLCVSPCIFPASCARVSRWILRYIYISYIPE